MFFLIGCSFNWLRPVMAEKLLGTAYLAADKADKAQKEFEKELEMKEKAKRWSTVWIYYGRRPGL